MEKKPFYLRELLNDKIQTSDSEGKSIEIYNNSSFEVICAKVWEYFNGQKVGVDDLERQKRAIIGYVEEVKYYKDRINDYLQKNNLLNGEFPGWYRDLSDGVFHQLWGLAGISQWYYGDTEELKNSSSAKIIGNKIFYMVNGKMKLMPQTISNERREQLKRALLSNDFRIRLDSDVPDIEMVTGERIKIFGENVTRKNMDTIIFRKFPVREYSFEKQIEMGTYPKEALEMFKSLVSIGYNMAFTGAVRTSKTTQLCTWLSYENNYDEGLIVETRPEIPIDKVLHNSPVIAIVADTEEKLSRIRTSIMRSDADYVIMAEARDGASYDIGLKSASVGARKCKITAHINTPADFPYEFAKEIVRVFGGNIENEAISVAKAYTLNLHFINHPENKAVKKLEGIYVFEFIADTYEIYIHCLCKYNILKDSWSYNNCITEEMKRIGVEQDYSAFVRFSEELERLSSMYAMDAELCRPLKPFYSR